MKTLAFTSGDINGIGPEICIKTINEKFSPGRRKIILFCPGKIFENASSVTKPAFNYRIIKENEIIPLRFEDVLIIDTACAWQTTGSPTKYSGLNSYNAVKSAFRFCAQQKADAMITAPVSKTAFNMARINYPGQTEILAELSSSKKFMMIFLSHEFICGLVTIHEQISRVGKLIQRKSVRDSIKILLGSLRSDLGIIEPKIAVLGLNPHAGENGKIGREEINAIIPAIRSFKNSKISGPMVPDAFFANQLFNNYDAVLGMYHDQVLIPFKMMNFNRGVNFTAGLPVIRTSPDHGTAFDIAGKGIADPGSMIEAVNWAEKIIVNRRRFINAG